MVSFFDLTHSDLKNWLQDNNYNIVHSKQCFKNIYSLNLPKWSGDLKDNLPSGLEDSLIDSFSFIDITLDSFVISQDGSIKFLFKLQDGYFIESVAIPESKRITVCVSSQVGCRQGCKFCATSKMGLKRSLKVSEIVLQVWLIKQWILTQNVHPFLSLAHLPLSNVVFMGMGEPLDNIDNVYKAILILTDEFGFNLSLKRISLSTCGHVQGLIKMIDLLPGLPIAISLHEVDDRRRSSIMPIANRFSIEEILEAIKYIEKVSKNDVLIQYVLIKDFNDSFTHAEKLATLLKGRRVKINLIPFNENPFSDFKTVDEDHMINFSKILFMHGFRVMIRFSKGADISGACGQLSAKKNSLDLDV